MNEPVVTEADREKARDVILAGDGGPESWTQILATALAAERAKARAPFLALVEFYDRHEYSTLNVDDLRELLNEETSA